MSRTIVLKSKHELGIAAVKQRLTDRFEALKLAYIDKVGSSEMTWMGDIAHVRVKALGQTVTAEVDVQEHDVTIDIHLPLIIAPFAGAIEALLKSNADALQADPKKS